MADITQKQLAKCVENAKQCSTGNVEILHGNDYKKLTMVTKDGAKPLYCDKQGKPYSGASVAKSFCDKAIKISLFSGIKLPKIIKK